MVSNKTGACIVAAMVGGYALACCAFVQLGMSRSSARQNQFPTEFYANRDNSVRLTKEGFNTWKSGDLKGAERLLRESLAVDSRWVDVWSYLAQVLEEQGRDREAADAYRHVFYPPAESAGSTFESDEVLLIKYAKLCERMGDKQEAARAFARVVQKPRGDADSTLPALPKNPRASDTKAMAYMWLGQAHGSHGDVEKAAEAFRTAATLRPNLAVAQFYYGYTLKQQGYREWKTNHAKGEATLALAVAVLKKAEALGGSEVREIARKEQAIYLPGVPGAATLAPVPQAATVDAYFAAPRP